MNAGVLLHEGLDETGSPCEHFAALSTCSALDYRRG
jgi:hypothetical protein